MVAITKSMVVLSALTAAGLIVTLETMLRAQEPSAAVQVNERFPRTDETFRPVTMIDFVAPKLADQGVKADRLSGATDGAVVRQVSRVITIERRIGANTSELMRLPLADLAQR